MSDLIEELNEWAEDGLARARDRADRIQQYIVFLSGGGLIAVYSVAPGYLDAGESKSTLLPIAAFLTVSLFFAGLQVFTQMRTQTEKLDFRDRLLAAKEKSDFDESKWKVQFTKHKKKSVRRAKNAQLHVILSLGSFIVGMFAGLFIFV